MRCNPLSDLLWQALDHFYESMREHGGVDFSVAQLTYKLESMRSRPSWQVALRACNSTLHSCTLNRSTRQPSTLSC